MTIDETLKNNLIADVENICLTILSVDDKIELRRAFEITIGHHYQGKVSDDDKKGLKQILIELETGELDKYAAYDLILTLFEIN